MANTVRVSNLEVEVFGFIGNEYEQKVSVLEIEVYGSIEAPPVVDFLPQIIIMNG